jgi:hypothetical protein
MSSSSLSAKPKKVISKEVIPPFNDDVPGLEFSERYGLLVCDNPVEQESS